MNPLDNTYSCAKCAAPHGELQVLIPAWFKIDRSFELVAPDFEAQDLAYWCGVCKETCRVDIVSVKDGHRASYGRWGSKGDPMALPCVPIPIHPHVKHITELGESEQ